MEAASSEAYSGIRKNGFKGIMLFLPSYAVPVCSTVRFSTIRFVKDARL